MNKRYSEDYTEHVQQPEDESTPFHCVVIKQTKEQILQRMTAGEPLRWVPRHTLGLDEGWMPLIRELLIGSDFLDNDSVVEAMELLRDGIISDNEDEVSGVCDYELS